MQYRNEVHISGTEWFQALAGGIAMMIGFIASAVWASLLPWVIHGFVCDKWETARMVFLIAFAVSAGIAAFFRWGVKEEDGKIFTFAALWGFVVGCLGTLWTLFVSICGYPTHWRWLLIFVPMIVIGAVISSWVDGDRWPIWLRKAFGRPPPFGH